MKQSQLKKTLRDYYSSDFNLDGLNKVIDFSNFPNREFGFVNHNGRFYRNLSFENPKALKDFLIDRAPLHAYVGAVYDNPASRDNPIHSLEWKGHELVFDIDLDEYDAVRKHVCDCQGADQVCTRCWQLVNLAISIIDETLRFDFGIKKIIWLFSGRRGVHGWAIDEIGYTLNQEQRMSIINYLTVIHGEDEKARVQDRNKFPPDFRKRIEHNVFDYFLKHARHKDLLSIGINSSRASNIRGQLKQQEGKIDDTLRRSFNKDLARINKYDEILRRWVPRIDHKVSIDLRRLLRMPSSIHGKTGKIARVMDPAEIFRFNPEEEPSIFT